MATKRTSKTINGIRTTQTYNTKTGKQTNSYSYKSGLTRFSYSNGKSYSTTNIGNGFYERRLLNKPYKSTYKVPKYSTKAKTTTWKKPRVSKRSTSRKSKSRFNPISALIVFIVFVIFAFMSKKH